MPARNSTPVAITCTAGTASASAQGQVMISTAHGDQQRLARRHADAEIPAEKRRQRAQMHRRRIASRHPVGEHHEARPRAPRPPRSAARIRPATCRRRWRWRARSAPRPGSACRRTPACRASPRPAGFRRSPGWRRASRSPRSTTPSTPMRSPVPTSTRSPGATDCWLRRWMLPSGCKHRDIGGAQRQQLFGGGPRLAARAVVEHAADQQEEQQRDGGVEIGVRAAAACVCARLMPVTRMHADADRHVHVGAPMAQRRSGGGEERPSGIGDRRHRDQRRDPVQQVARRRPHVVQQAADLAGPDADRQQHDVAGGEAGDRERTQQGAAGGVLRRRERRRRRTAPAGSRAPRSRRPDASACPAAPRQTRRSRRVVMLTRPGSTSGSRASTDSISQTQAPHCRPSTASVSSCAPSLRSGDVAREVPAVGGVRARRAQRRVEHALRVVAAEAEGLDRCRRRRRSRGSRSGGRRRGQAAMDAGGCGAPPQPSAASRERGRCSTVRALSHKAGEGWGGGKRHRTMIRRVAAIVMAADGCRQRQVPLPWHRQRRVGDIAARRWFHGTPASASPPTERPFG